MQVIIDNLLTNYSLAGKSGKYILLIHGWGSNQQAFDGISKVLSASYRIVSVDLPGMGGSQTPNDPWSLDDYCDFIVDFLDKINIKNIYSIIGHSNGGSIAIKLASTNRIKVKKLILLGSAGIRDQEKPKKRAIQLAAKVGKSALRIAPKILNRKLKNKLYKSIGSQALDNPLLEETFKKIVGEDVQESAQKITIPTLIIYGKNDQDTPSEYGKLFQAKIKESKLYIIDDAGHYVFIDKPKEVLNLINVFLKNKENH